MNSELSCGKPHSKGLHQKLRHKLKDNIKTNLKRYMF